MSCLLIRQGFVVNEYTKDLAMFAQLKVSEEAAEAAGNVQASNQLINSASNQLHNQLNSQLNIQVSGQLINKSSNQLINQASKQLLNKSGVQLSSQATKQQIKQPTTSKHGFSMEESMMQHYSKTPSLVTQANNLYHNPSHIDNHNSKKGNYDSHKNLPYDHHHYDNNHNNFDNNNTNPYDNHRNNNYDTNNQYENIMINPVTYYGGEEMVVNEDDVGLYNNEIYNNSDILYNTYTNNEEVQDDSYPPIFYPNNYTESNFYQPTTTNKENNNKFFQTQSTTTTTSTTKSSPFFKTATPMTLRQQHLRQRKRIDNSRLRVCKYYNVERGCKFLSTTQQYCPNLHLCHHFVAEKCIYGNEKCRRSHNIHDPSVESVLKSNNIDMTMTTDSIMEEIRRRLNVTDDSLSSESESDEDLHQYPRMSSPITTRSTLTPTACEFTPSKNTNTPQSTPKTNHNSNNKNTTLKNPPILKSRSAKISTFVFLDLEATGFHQSKITELSLVAVHRSSIEATINSTTITDKPVYLPRIINKLTICVNPGKPIERRAAEITGECLDFLQVVIDS